MLWYENDEIGSEVEDAMGKESRRQEAYLFENVDRQRSEHDIGIIGWRSPFLVLLTQ